MILDCDGNEIKLPVMVVSPRSHRTYHVLRIKPNGRLKLHKHGQPPIDNADPRRWRVVPRLEVEHV